MKAKPSGNLKPTEIRPLVMAARAAFDIQEEAGLLAPEETFDSWRRSQCLACVGKPGLTACHHADFQPLMAHFKTLSGNISDAFSAHLKTGRQTSASAADDTLEARRILAHQIASAVRAHTAAGGKVGVGYLVAIVRAKTRRPALTIGSDWEAGLADRCTVSQLSAIRNTIINRISAADGVGQSRDRNKSQRRPKTRPSEADPF